MSDKSAWIEKAEQVLEYYQHLQSSYAFANRMISRLKWQGMPSDGGGGAGDVTGIRAERPRNTLTQILQLQDWQIIATETERQMTEIENALDAICEKGCQRKKRLLEMWYVEKMTKEDIADVLKYSREWVYKTKDKAIVDFAVALFGKPAFDELIKGG